jgi:hypothetical protein
MLTPEQVAWLQVLIERVEKSECGEGEIRIEIKNGHVRRAWVAAACYFPKPEDRDKERPRC